MFYRSFAEKIVLQTLAHFHIIIKLHASEVSWRCCNLNELCSYTVVASGRAMLQYGGLVKMPYTFTNGGYANIHFTYGFCNGNSRTAIVEYQQCYPHRRTFNTVHRILKETGSFPQANTEHEQ